MSSGSYVENLKEKLKDITKCSICTETLKDARYLPCVHSFCLKCIQTYGKDKKEADDSMECPLCRKPITFDSDGFEELPVNHFINKLIDVNRISGKEGHECSSNEFCDLCAEIEPGKPAKGYCVNCRNQLCSACLHTHSKEKDTKSHKTVTMNKKRNSDVLLKMSVNYCQSHPSQEMILYCADCQTASCGICYVAKHKEHKCTDIANASTELSQQINRCAMRINDQMSQTETVVKQIDLTVGDFEKQIKSAEDSITRKYEETKTLLASQHTKLLDQLTKFRSKRLKELQKLREKSEHELIMTKSFDRYWNVVKERGSACDIVQAGCSIHKRGEELVEQHEKQHSQREQSSQSSYYKVEFIPTEASEKCTNLLGQLCQKVQSLRMNCPGLHVDWRSLLQSGETKTVLQAGSRSISGITIYKEELFIVGEGSGNIEVYNIKDTNSLSRQISVTGLTYSASIVSCVENNCLYVSSWSQSQIHRISLVDDTQRAWPLQSGRPWGLSISSQHHLLVSMYNTEHIKEYDTTGKLVRNIQLSGGIQGIHHAIELESGNFVVAECEPQSRVHVTDKRGNVIHTYGQSHVSSVGELYNHTHLGVDIFGNILVADERSKKLRVFDCTLQYLGDINTAPLALTNPFCFHWDKQIGRLLVGESSGRLLSIKTDK